MRLSRRRPDPTASWVSCAVLAAALTAATACKGEDGSQGPPGPPGPPGGSGPTDTTLTRGDEKPGVILSIVSLAGASGVDGTFQVGDHVSVKFTLKKTSGDDWDIAEMSSFRMLISGPSNNYQRVVPEVNDVEAAAVHNTDGSFTYTFAGAIPATYAAPFNDTTTFGLSDGELAGEALVAGTYTVGAYCYWGYTVDGDSFRDVGNAEVDFLFGGATTLSPREVVKSDNCNQCHTDLRAHGGDRKDVKLCLLCHTAGSEDKNNPAVAGGTPDVTVSMKVMIHKLHNGVHLPSVLGVTTITDPLSPDYGDRDYAATPKPYEVIGFQDSVNDFSEVAFPVWPNLTSAMPRDKGYSGLTSTQKDQEDSIREGVTDCAKCHGDPDGAGTRFTAPAQGDLAYVQTSRQACGSCHDDLSWDAKYNANGGTMFPQATDSACHGCHPETGSPLAVRDAHLHPLHDPDLNPGVNFVGTSVTGGTGAGGRFQNGDRPSIVFTVKDDAGTDVDLPTLDSASSILVGPTTNRQAVMPYAGPNSVSLSPYDFSGRLAASSTSNKGTMSRVLLTGTPVSETLTVAFTSATAFGVTGSVSGNLGASALPTSPSTNPSGSSIASIDLTSAAVAQTVTVAFSTAVDFTVTGSVTGAMGVGKLPAATSSSMRFVSGGGLSFTATAGSTAFVGGNNIYLVIFKAAPANPLMFVIVAGRTSFAATDRFYYEVVAPGASYTLAIPMDLPLEYLGAGSGVAGQSLVAGNLPVYFGRQTLFEATAVAVRTTLTAATKPLDRYVDVVSTANFVTNDYCVIEGAAGVGAREYVQVGLVESATRLWFKTPLRYAHAAGATADEPTLTYRQEGATNAYTLTAATGTVTSVAPFGLNNGLVMNYRTDGRFGFLRHAGDTLQAYFAPPMNDTNRLGQDWGEWTGLPFEDGTYTASVWGSKNLNVGIQGEVQQYRAASTGANVDFLFGASATTIEPYSFISSSANCYACHTEMLFHGGGRSGFDTCLLCHGISGAEDWAQYNPPSGSNPVAADNGVTVSFRTMLHKIHRGADLANASTYNVYGNGASSNTYGEVEFPALPSGVQQCVKCHGTATAWMEPSPRTHSGGLQTVPTRAWRAECNACHDGDPATAHIDAMTAPNGAESCEVCHGLDADWSVERMHKIY